MTLWMDADIDEVVAQRGYPHEEREFRGRKLSLWHHNKFAYIPQTTTGSASGLCTINHWWWAHVLWEL